MIAYGIKTWKSIAMPAVLFLGLSVFLFLQAVKMNLTIRDEVEEYGQITCYINETAQERLLEQKISEVFPGGKGSFVYEIPVILQCNSISKEINVTGIDTQMIPGTNTSSYTPAAGTLASKSLIIIRRKPFPIMEPTISRISQLSSRR